MYISHHKWFFGKRITILIKTFFPADSSGKKRKFLRYGTQCAHRLKGQPTFSYFNIRGQKWLFFNVTQPYGRRSRWRTRSWWPRWQDCDKNRTTFAVDCFSSRMASRGEIRAKILLCHNRKTKTKYVRYWETARLDFGCGELEMDGAIVRRPSIASQKKVNDYFPAFTVFRL